MRTTARALFVLLFALAPPAAADESAALFQEASRALQAGRWQEAETALLRVREHRPGDPDVQALLGVARYELGLLPEAVAAFRSALRDGTRYEARALYTMGIALSRLDEADEAQECFARILREHPGSPEAARLREVDRGGAPGYRPWTFQLFGSVQRDDNPIRGTRIDDLATEAPPPPPDWLGQAYLSADRRFAGAGATARATVFRMDYGETDSLDFTFAEARLERALLDSRRTRVVPGYAFRHSWLDRDRFEILHRIDVQATRTVASAWSSSLAMSVERADHPEAAFEDLDGTRLGGSLAVALHGAPRSVLRSSRLTVGMARTGAQRDYLEHSDREAELQATFALPGRSALGLAVEARERDFAATGPGFPARREDFRWLGSVSATRPLTRAVWARIAASLADNDSTIGRYDYRQLTVGTTLGARF